MKSGKLLKEVGDLYEQIILHSRAYLEHFFYTSGLIEC